MTYIRRCDTTQSTFTALLRLLPFLCTCYSTNSGSFAVALTGVLPCVERLASVEQPSSEGFPSGLAGSRLGSWGDCLTQCRHELSWQEPCLQLVYSNASSSLGNMDSSSFAPVAFTGHPPPFLNSAPLPLTPQCTLFAGLHGTAPRFPKGAVEPREMASPLSLCVCHFGELREGSGSERKAVSAF